MGVTDGQEGLENSAERGQARWSADNSHTSMNVCMHEKNIYI